MQNRSTRYWVGIALILVGSYALAERLDLLYIDSGALAGVAFLLIGAALVAVQPFRDIISASLSGSTSPLKIQTFTPIIPYVVFASAKP